MPAESSLNEIVLFEIPARSEAGELLAELSWSRHAWMEVDDEIAVVGVILNPDAGDLASLLRKVATSVARRGLLAIRFELDGRTYVLEPAAAAQATAA
jgi:hypothetical protein